MIFVHPYFFQDARCVHAAKNLCLHTSIRTCFHCRRLQVSYFIYWPAQRW